MIEIKNILVPVDFSEPSRKAARYGLTLASQLKARLTLAHIVPDVSALTHVQPPESHAFRREQYEMAKKDIEQIIPSQIAREHDVHTIVKIGDVETELLQLVQTENASVVVMGTRGRRNPGRWFLGSVTEHILRKVPVPVLTVSHVEGHAKAIELGFVVLRRILYATDLTAESQKGLRYAIQLAKTAGAQLTAVHVATNLDFMFWGGRFVGSDPDVQQQVLHDLQAKLRKFVAQEKPADMDIETVVLPGKAYSQILTFAEEREMDMIVLNLQNKDLMDRAMLGATAERVVRLAHVPVFSVPATAPDAKGSKG